MTNADEISRLFEAERAVQPPDQGLERGLSRLLTDVAQRAAPLPIAAGPLNLGLSLVSKWLIVGFVVGLSGAGVVSQVAATSSAAAPISSAHRAIVETTVAVDAPAREAGTALPSSTEVQEDSAQIVSRPVLAASTSALPADSTTFAEELRLIGAARREQEGGRARTAEAWLLEHARRFPDGVFALEREALQVLVTCSTKKQPELARAFAASHAQSPMVARLLRVCGAPEASATSKGHFSEIEK